MADMYEATKTENKKPKRHRLWIIVAAVVVFLVLSFVLCALPWIKHRMYWKFVSELSTDTSAFSKKDMVTCDYQGERFKVSTEDCYELYKKLCYRTDVDTKFAPLTPEPGFHIEYANGSTLDIWPLECVGGEAANQTGIGIYYHSANGLMYSYTSEDIKFSSIEETLVMPENS